jgi:hypothetical protein
MLEKNKTFSKKGGEEENIIKMKKYFVDYLNSIGVTEVLKEKINEIYEFYHFIYPEEVKDIFITDNIQNNGERTYGKTCFFSDNFYMETHLYQKKDNFYIAPLKNQIISLSIEKERYDFKKATEDSKLTLIINFPGDEKYLNARKNNCDYLRIMIVKYFLQNLQLYQEPRSRSIEDADLDLGLDLQKGLKFVIDKEDFRKSPDIKEILKRHGYKKKRTKNHPTK